MVTLGEKVNKYKSLGARSSVFEASIVVDLQLPHEDLHILEETQRITALASELHGKLCLVGNTEDLGLHFDLLVDGYHGLLFLDLLRVGALLIVRRSAS